MTMLTALDNTNSFVASFHFNGRLPFTFEGLYFSSTYLIVRVVMDWILEYPIQIQICGLDFKSKSIFFYESNLESKFKYLDWILNPNPYFL